jgi:hypothetical protein
VIVPNVPAASIWALVEERRRRYGLSWGEIAAWLGGWALPVTWQSEIPVDEARAILERLAQGYVATEGVAAATQRQRLAERQMSYYHKLREYKGYQAPA